MRLLTVLLLCGLFPLLASMAFPSPHSLAMQASPTPTASIASGVCKGEQKWRGYTKGDQLKAGKFQPVAAVFNPANEHVGVVPAIDVDRSDATEHFTGNLGLTFLTLPPNACRSGSLFYPSAIITVTAGTIEIFVEPDPDGVQGDPAPEGTIWRSGTGFEDLTLPGPITINADEWVTLQNRSSVGFWNNSSSNSTLLVAANHLEKSEKTIKEIQGRAFQGDQFGCKGGCKSRRP